MHSGIWKIEFAKLIIYTDKIAGMAYFKSSGNMLSLSNKSYFAGKKRTVLFKKCSTKTHATQLLR